MLLREGGEGGEHLSWSHTGGASEAGSEVIRQLGRDERRQPRKRPATQNLTSNFGYVFLLFGPYLILPHRWRLVVQHVTKNFTRMGEHLRFTWGWRVYTLNHDRRFTNDWPFITNFQIGDALATIQGYSPFD